MDIGFHPRAWVVWVLAGAAAAMSARNPLYSLIVLLAAWAVGQACAIPGHPGGLPLLRLGLTIVCFSALFNALLAHFGQTVLLELPPSWPLIGGPITFEAIVFGAVNGLVLTALLGIFNVLNLCVPAHALVRLTPRAFHSLGLVLLIAVSYGPQTTRHLGLVREAQAVRGHQLRGLRDWRPIVLPLLIGGLERSMNLAEAMVARGYGATTSVGPTLAMRAGLALGLLGLLAGWVLAIFGNSVGLPLLLAGAMLLLGLLLRQRRDQRFSVYRPQRWTWRDSALVAGAALALLATQLPPYLPKPWRLAAALFYYPYPRVQLPGFSPLVGMALAALALPAFLSRGIPAAVPATGQASPREEYDHDS